MRRPVTVSIPHSLGKQEARRRIDEGFAAIERQLAGGLAGIVSFREQWEGDRLLFEGGGLGQRVCGRVDVLADCVRIEVDLPEILAAIAERLKSRLKHETQRLLEEP